MIKAEALDYTINHKDILKHKQKKIRERREIIGNNIAELESQISAYCDTDTDYASLTPMITTSTLKDVLYELYDSSEEPIKTMKDEIKEKYEHNYFSHKAERCPYCGILRQSPSALDHFLPRGEFPEYSILSTNLVYICETCNNKAHKGSLINDKEGNRLFLHPYTDNELESNTFIECSIVFDDLTVLPTFSISSEIKSKNPDLYHIACNHMKKLKLDKRYSSLVENDLLQKFRNKFTNLNKKTRVRHYKEDIPLKDILSFINDKIEECDETDLNNWEIVFWKKFVLETEWFETLCGKQLESTV